MVERVTLGTANKALLGRTLNLILSIMGRDTCWDSGCTSHFTTLHIIKELGVQFESLALELIIVEASGNELEILGNYSKNNQIIKRIKVFDFFESLIN